MANNETKVIPKNVWKEFNEYWDKTEWENLTVADIKKHLGNGKYVFVPLPKDITNKLEARIWYMRIAEFKEKGNGKTTVSFSGDTTTLESLFGSEPITTKAVNEKLREYVKAKKVGK